MPQRRRSVATSVIVTLTAVAGVLLGALVVIGYGAERNRQLRNLRDGLSANTEQAAAALTLPVWNFDHEQVGKVLESLMKDRDVYGAIVKMSDVRGTIHATVRNEQWQSVPLNKEFSAVDMLSEERTIASPDEVLGTVRVFVTPKFVEAQLNRTLFLMAGTIASVYLILIVSLYLLLSRLVLKPLLDVERYAVAVSSGQSGSVSAPLASFHGELETLRSAIEAMVAQLDARYAALQRSEDALRKARDELELRVAERTAELVAANTRLQELDRLKSQFLATMSHELRTPLNSIIGFTGLMREGMAGPVNEEQQRQLNMVYNSAQHLLSLISDLLDLSRIEAGRMELESSRFDFAGVVSDVVQALDPIVRQKKLTISSELASTRLEIEGDRKRCFQVLLNIVNNAVKFTDEGQVRISATIDDKLLRVGVSDTGIGIKKEQLPMLFEAFRQIDGSAKRIYEGTGLGLYLCRKLLFLMGGDISVESEFGKGSLFTFAVPRRLNHIAEGTS